MAYTNPTVADFKAYFDRDFPYGVTNEYVKDTDIQKAIDLAAAYISELVFCDQTQYTIGFLYLTAHYLVENLRASSQGISGQFSWLQTGRSVGSVSESLAIPDRILQNPSFAFLTKTTYGAKYLELILPYLTAPFFTVAGATHP